MKNVQKQDYFIFQSFILSFLSDSPFSRIEVVCPVPDVLGKAQWMPLIGDEHIAFRRVGRLVVHPPLLLEKNLC